MCYSGSVSVVQQLDLSRFFPTVQSICVTTMRFLTSKDTNNAGKQDPNIGY